MAGQYPLTLPNDPRVEWQYSHILQTEPDSILKCYYHNTSNIPIYMHHHKFYELNIITSGHGRHYMNNQNFDAGTGDVFGISPNINHGYWSAGNLEIFHILISQQFLIQYERELSLLPGYKLLFEIEPFVRSGFPHKMFLHLNNERLCSLKKELDELSFLQICDYQGKEVMKNAKALYVIALLSHYIAEEYALQKKEDPQSGLFFSVVNCIEYIHLHFSEKIALDELCKRFNMSRSTLFRNFQKLCHMSPYEYQLKCRLDCAKRLLKTTDDTILDISLACGFFDSSHFIKVFTKYIGVSPSAFRQNDMA